MLLEQPATFPDAGNESVYGRNGKAEPAYRPDSQGKSILNGVAGALGGRAFDESQLGAADVTLSDEVLDRIDEIVRPGSLVNPADTGWDNPALQPSARRR